MTDELRPLTVEEWIKDRHANCLRIAKTKPHGSDRAGWMEDAEYFQAVLDRLSARVGEGWCFDMERAPKNGSDILGYWKRSNLYDVICWNDLRETKDRWETSDDACAMSPPTCWMLPPPPETNDDK